LIFRETPDFSCTILILTNLITFYKIALNITTHGLHFGFQMAFMASFIIIKILLQHFRLVLLLPTISPFLMMIKIICLKYLQSKYLTRRFVSSTVWFKRL